MGEIVCLLSRIDEYFVLFDPLFFNGFEKELFFLRFVSLDIVAERGSVFILSISINFDHGFYEKISTFK